jgi:hypothetical protein
MRTLPELAAQVADRDLMGESALAEVVESMRLLNAAGRRIDAAVGAMQQCRVPFDVKPFRSLQDCLNDAHGALSHIPLEQAERQAMRRSPE